MPNLCKQTRRTTQPQKLPLSSDQTVDALARLKADHRHIDALLCVTNQRQAELERSPGALQIQHRQGRHFKEMLTKIYVPEESDDLSGSMLRDHLAPGALIRLIPDWAPRSEIIHAVFPSRRGMLPSVRALLDFLAKRFAAIDED